MKYVLFLLLCAASAVAAPLNHISTFDFVGIPKNPNGDITGFSGSATVTVKFDGQTFTERTITFGPGTKLIGRYNASLQVLSDYSGLTLDLDPVRFDPQTSILHEVVARFPPLTPAAGPYQPALTFNLATGTGEAYYASAVPLVKSAILHQTSISFQDPQIIDLVLSGRQGAQGVPDGGTSPLLLFSMGAALIGLFGLMQQRT